MKPLPALLISGGHFHVGRQTVLSLSKMHTFFVQTLFFIFYHMNSFKYVTVVYKKTSNNVFLIFCFSASPVVCLSDKRWYQIDVQVLFE